MSMLELEQAVLALPAERRRALADLIESSLDEPADPAWVAAWVAIAARRLEELRQGRVDGVSAEKALSEVRAALQTCA
jgi:hypothetical protein